MRDLVQGYDLVFIDEAQRVTDIAIGLKILADQVPQVRLIVTGSSSPDLAGKVREPLTGRTWTFSLFPIGQCELAGVRNRTELRYQLDERLVYGAYPEVFALEGERLRRSYLNELVASFLYKDVLSMSLVRNPDKLRTLLQLLAYQIGQQVSMAEQEHRHELYRPARAVFRHFSRRRLQP